MQLWSRQNLSGAGILVACMMLANFLNFAFNAFLGRQLSYEQFGMLTFYNTILFLSGILFTAVGSTINHRTAYLNGKYGHEAGSSFTRSVRRVAIPAMVGVSLLWLALSAYLADLFRVPDVWSMAIFSPIFILGMAASVNKGFMQGNLRFTNTALVVLFEPFLKLLAAAALVFLGHKDLVYASLPVSLLASFALSSFLVRFAPVQASLENQFKFPKRFLAAALVTNLSTNAFLTLDLVLVKYFMSPEMAGQYSMLSLVGKMVFFLGSLLNGLVITFVSRDAGERRNTRKTFRRMLGASAAMTAVGVALFGVLGSKTIPILLGAKTAAILPFLPMYTVAIGLFALSSVVVVYHLAREQYSFSALALAMTVAMCAGIVGFHGSINAIVHVVFWTSLAYLSSVTLLHLVQRNSHFLLANILDLFDVFRPRVYQPALPAGHSRILVFNWRDTRHAFAGGAEVYVHELARRWVKDGNRVTVFCGNDGYNPRNETIEGVEIVRRGGFYMVYFWAFVYYVTQFRGRFDVIIDCHNGIPFFTPLYAKERVFSVIHHVHQDIFYKFLPKPMAAFASVLENRLMPYAYRNVKFITVSESTKAEMEQLDIVGKGIEIIHNGVDLSKMAPGQKAAAPMVLYLGRLKAYKSVDVLVRAFKDITGRVPNAKLVVAGSGEEQSSLQKLVAELKLEKSVTFTGKISEDEKIRLMREAWVFVNPSMMEGWGITTIEASASGTPVVASDVPGLRDSVRDNETGFLVPYGDHAALADKIAMLLEDGNLRRKFSAQAMDWASQFSWDESALRCKQLITI